jgi:MscS family membrane protein
MERGWLGVRLVVVASAIWLTAGAVFGADSVNVAEREQINPGLSAPPPAVLRTTPAGAWHSFLQLAGEGRFPFAAHLLDLTEVPLGEQRQVGAEIAEKLYRVVEKLGVKPDAVTVDTPEGPTEDDTPLNVVVVDRFQRDGIAGELWLRRTRSVKTGETAWLFTRRTVSSVPLWFRVIVEGKQPEVARGPLNAGLGTVPVGVDRENPRATYTGFLSAARKGEFDVAAFYLDLAGIPPSAQKQEGASLARQLMLVLVRKAWVDPAEISNDPAGAPEQGVPADEEVLAPVKVRGHTVTLSLTRHYDRDLGPVWVFSPGTVEEIGTLYDVYGYGIIGKALPTVFFTVSFGGLQLWQWTALVAIVVLGWFLGRLVGHWVILLFRVLAQRTASTWDDTAVRALDGPLGVVFWGAWLALASPWIGLDPSTFHVTHVLFRLLILLGLGWLLFRTVDALTAQMRHLAGDTNTVALGFLPIMARVSKVLIVVFVLLAALDAVGVKVVTVLAGLGLGGLAVAFAAQKTLENLFGAVAIAGDRPFKVGDFVTIGGTTGTVEDVGLRSTRVRTIQRTVVTIPNGTVASDTIVNFAARDRMLYNPVIGVVYSTTAEQLTLITDEIRRLLLSHPRVWQDAHRVRFKGFGASSLDIEVFAWLVTRDYNEYTALAEELNFAILRIVLEAGSSFAFPSQTVYFTREGGIDEERASRAADTVASRREAGELAVPEPSDELRERLRPKDVGRET